VSHPSEVISGRPAWADKLFLGLRAGAIVGLVVGGFGGRVAMRLIAIWQGRTPMWSVSGSLTVVFVATLFGIGAGVLYAFVRPHLPGRGLARALLFGVGIQVIGWLFDFPLPKRPPTGSFVAGDAVARLVLAVLFFVAVCGLELVMRIMESRANNREPAHQ
jgi:hypothetical protein